MTNSANFISAQSDSADTKSQQAGCDSTFFANQEAAVQRIREMMMQSDDPRIVG